MNELDLMMIACLVMSGLALAALLGAVVRHLSGGVQMSKLSILSDDEEYWEPSPAPEGQHWLKGSLIIAAFTAVAISIGCTVMVAGRYGH